MIQCWVDASWCVALYRGAVGINGFAAGVGGQIVQYEKLVSCAMNGRKVNGGVGFNDDHKYLTKGT